VSPALAKPGLRSETTLGEPPGEHADD